MEKYELQYHELTKLIDSIEYLEQAFEDSEPLTKANIKFLLKKLSSIKIKTVDTND